MTCGRKSFAVFIENLVKYRDALSNRSRDNMHELLREGRERKEAIDGLIYRN